MPTTETARMLTIAEELYQEGRYTQAASVATLVAERDALRRQFETLLAPLVARRDALLLDAVTNGAGYHARHADALSPVPEGYDTVLGYLAKHHPEVLDAFDYTDPTNTMRDGWWLSHRTKEQQIWVAAPACLQAHGIKNVRAYPTALLAKRWP